MANDPNSITNARTHYLNWQTPLAEQALIEDLAGANDRSVVLSVTALLDVALQSRLALHLKLANKKEHARAFEADGPLSRFAAKIDMAFWLELLDERSRGQLHDLRHLRNICAHSRLPISFSEARLANVLKRILHPTGSFPLLNGVDDAVKRTLIAEALFLHNIISFGRERATEMMRKVYLDKGMQPPF